MPRFFIFAVMALLVGAMGSGGDPSPPSRVNPPSAADVDAAQSAPREAPEAAASVSLHVLSATESAPEEFLWQARPVVIFADTAADPAFQLQLERLQARPEALLERDVVVITDADPSENSLWRQKLHPRGFSLVIIDKDGQVKQRKPQPWSVPEIAAAIDKFPLRREEIGRARLMP